MKYLAPLIAFMLGFVVAQQAYSSMFDPLQYWDQTKNLAFQAYFLGCVEGDRADALCHSAAADFLEVLSRI